MADFNALEALINAHIKKNGVQAITGNILNGILRGMVSALGKGYTIAGVAVPSSDPGTMTGPLAYLAYTAGTYTHFGGLEVGQGEVSMLIYNEAEWHKEVLFILSATATVDDNVGTPEVGVSFVDGLLTFDFRNMKGNPGNDGDAAGFGTINATVDGNVGTPGVSVQSSGPDTAKNITFQFTNLKGETGVTSVVATVDNTVGTPTCTVSLVGQQLTLAFSGLKGAQGDTGSSVDYPFTIVNNLTTNDPTQALSAAMGVQLESEVSQLEADLFGDSKDSDADLDVADEQGNVLVRFKDGDIQTKEFNSKEDGRIANVFDTSLADMNIADENGNVIVQFEGGHIKTKEFDSRNIKATGGEGKDWSDETELIELPIPKALAVINIICTALPTSPNKDDNLTAILEYTDKFGNYFKKTISSFNRQGRSSMLAPKSNYSFDIDDGTKIRFGSWVAQDSFHLKANYIDAFRGGRNIVSYRLQTEINDSCGWGNARPWRKQNKGNVTIYGSNGNINADLNNNALGLPDGFPVKLYVNGEFHGLYTLNLKKHRDNMVMDKSTATNIQLDGDGWATFFQGENHIDWTAFEVRNPKYMVYATSDSDAAKDREYDADISQREIAGETDSLTATAWNSGITYTKNAIVTYDGRMYLSLKASNTGNTPVACTSPKNVFKNATEWWIDITFCNQVKQYIRNLANTYNAITTKADFETYFDSEWSIDYVLQVNALMNVDVICNNTQWCTWDGIKWWPMAYDQDQCYGLYFDGSKIRGNDVATADMAVNNCMLGVTIQMGTPLSKLFTLFKDEMDARYKSLLDSGLLSTEHIVRKLAEWCAVIGIDNYSEDFNKWPETPSFRASGTYTNWPTTGGFYDSVERVEKYLAERVIFMKNYFNY